MTPSFFETRPFTPVTPSIPTRSSHSASHLGLMNNSHPASESLPPNIHLSNPNNYYLPQVGVVKFPPPPMIHNSSFSASTLNKVVATKSYEAIPDPLRRERAMFRKLLSFAASKKPLPSPTAKIYSRLNLLGVDASRYNVSCLQSIRRIWAAVSGVPFHVHDAVVDKYNFLGLKEVIVRLLAEKSDKKLARVKRDSNNNNDNGDDWSGVGNPEVFFGFAPPPKEGAIRGSIRVHVMDIKTSAALPQCREDCNLYVEVLGQIKGCCAKRVAGKSALFDFISISTYEFDKSKQNEAAIKIVVANSNTFGDMQPFGEFSITFSELSAIREISWVGLRTVSGGRVGAASLSGHIKLQAKFVRETTALEHLASTTSVAAPATANQLQVRTGSQEATGL